MRILIVTQYFWPESFTINHIAGALRDQGHYVVVATGKPNYPEGVIFEGYKSTGVQKEVFDGDIEVVRVPLRPRGKSNGLNLFRNYLSFIWNGIRFFPSLLKGQEFDAIFVFAGSPNVSIPAIPLRRIKKAHLAIWILDLWPESLSATGFIHNRFILWLVKIVVRWVHSCSDTILIQSKAFMAPVSKYSRREKIVYFPNTVDISMSTGTVSPIADELLNTLKSYFCVVFAGNIGTAQSIETIVDAAFHLKDMPDIRLVLVGSGSMSEWVNQKKNQLNLDNLIIAGRYPMSTMPVLYSHAGCLLATLKNEKIFSYTIPGKVQAYLAAGKPIIAAINGEGARVVAEAGAGLTCSAEDAVGLAKCIKIMSATSESDRNKMGLAGRQYFLQNFEIRQQAARLVEILNERMAGKSGIVIDEEFSKKHAIKNTQ
jgi:glycosyltransferase involved in cell wall biosynthesis